MAKAAGASFVVVGVDGSEPSEDALEWAAGQARLAGADPRVVCTWDFPAPYGWAPDHSDADIAAQARKGLDTTVAQVLGDVPEVP